MSKVEHLYTLQTMEEKQEMSDMDGHVSLLAPEALASLPQLQGLLTRSKSGLRLKLSLFGSPLSCKRATRDCQSEA